MNKKSIKTFGLFVIAFIIINFASPSILEGIDSGLDKFNNKVNDNIRADREASAAVQMNEKYGIDFKAHDSFRDMMSNKVTVWMHPTSNSDIKFRVNLDSNGKVIDDNFINMKISNEIYTILKDHLPSDIETAAIISSIKDTNPSNEINQSLNENREKLGVSPIKGENNLSIDTNPNVTLEDYIQAYNPEYFSGYMIVKDTGNIKPEMFEEAFKEVYKATSNRMFQANVHLIEAEKYEECYKGFTERLYTNSGYLSEFYTERIGLQAKEDGFFVYER